MEKEFNTMPVWKLMLRLGIPAMFAQLFNILYSITDRIFVGNIPGAGELALASVGVCAPAVTAITAFSFMIGTGGASLMSICLGRGEKKEAQKTINIAFIMLLVVSVAVTGLVLLWKKEILYLLGCSDEMYPYASDYFTVYVAGTVFALCGGGMNAFILAQGHAKQGMLAVSMGAVINTVLDPLLIYGLDMGITGAAVATVISQACVMIYVLWFLGRKNRAVRLGFGGYEGRIAGRILYIGMMPFLITLLDNLIVMLLNMQLRKYGGDLLGDRYIACAAIVQSFMVLIASPAQGITTGCSTVISYHYGAKHYSKVMASMKWLLILCGVYMLIPMAVSQLCPEVFVGLFSNDPENIRLASQFVARYSLGAVGIAVQFTFVDGLNVMGKVLYAMPLSLFRKGLYILCVLILPLVVELEYIFYAETISDVIGPLFTLAVFFAWVRPKLKRELA